MKIAESVQPATSGDNAPLLDLTAIVADFRRFSKFFVIVFGVVSAAIFIPILTQAPKYSAAASVMIDPRTNNTTQMEEVLSGLPSDTTQIDTEVEILQSNALAERVVTSLKLDQDPEFNGALRKSGGFLGFGASVAPADEKLTPLQQRYRRQAIINSVLGGLDVRRAGTTRIIAIGYTSLSPEKSARIANEWARLYLTQQIEAKFQATKEASDWLNVRLGELRGEVLAKEAAVQNYKIANNLLSSEGATLTEQEISNLNQNYATVKVDAAEAEARLNTARRQLREGSTGEDVGEALNSTVIKDLRSQRTGVSRRIAEMETRYGPLHPDIIKSRRELEDIDTQIKAEIQRIISNLEAEASVQRQRAASLAGSVGSARGTLAGNNRAMVRLNELERDAESVRTLYESYLNRFKQTSTQEGIEKTDARIVSNASLPSGPSSPKLPLSLALSFVVGAGVATGSVLVRRALDSGLISSADVEAHLNQPYMASIADLASTLEAGNKAAQPTEYIREKPLSAFAEGFRSLRAALLYSRLGEDIKVIAVTSSLPGEGKTTTSVNLAQIIAMAGQSVVVVDCDLRRRSINRVLGVDVTNGLLEVLSGVTSLDGAILTDNRGVHYLPLAKSAHTPKDVFGSVAMERLLETLRGRYDIVILDTAPVLPVVDTRILARKADITVMLARWRKTPRKAVQTSLGLLEDLGVKIAGVALTQVNIKEQARYGYGDSGYYYKQYKKYYAD